MKSGKFFIFSRGTNGSISELEIFYKTCGFEIISSSEEKLVFKHTEKSLCHFEIYKESEKLPHPSEDDLLVLFIKDKNEYEKKLKELENYPSVSSCNPYWDKTPDGEVGKTFVSPDKFRVVIHNSDGEGFGLRIAKPVNDCFTLDEFYKNIGLDEFCRFKNHNGFHGIVFSYENFQLEFTTDIEKTIKIPEHERITILEEENSENTKDNEGNIVIRRKR